MKKLIILFLLFITTTCYGMKTVFPADVVAVYDFENNFNDTLGKCSALPIRNSSPSFSGTAKYGSYSATGFDYLHFLSFDYNDNPALWTPMRNATQFTIMFWVKYPASFTIQQTALVKVNGPGSPGTYGIMHHILSTTFLISAYGNSRYDNATYTLFSTDWQRHQFEWDGTNGKLYINGNLYKTFTTQPNIFTDYGAGNKISIGFDYGQGNETSGFSGNIDRLIFSTKLYNGAEITATQQADPIFVDPSHMIFSVPNAVQY